MDKKKYIDIDERITLTDPIGREYETTVRNILDINGVVYTAADVRPVVRGRWISHDFVDMGKGRYTGSVECSACGRFLPLKENFCPNCGADMREANDEKA